MAESYCKTGDVESAKSTYERVNINIKYFKIVEFETDC